MAVDVLLGLQWGDEGKGKIVDFLSDQYDIVCRFQGGPNAGHTLKIDGNKYVLHTIPSGIFRDNILNLIGNGVVIDPITLRREIETLPLTIEQVKARLLIAYKAHLILPTHRLIDAASEASKGKDKIGSTLKGIGPTYMDKTGRNGLRIGEINSPNFKEHYVSLKEKHFGILSNLPTVDFDLEAEEKKWFESIDFLRQFKMVNCEYLINDMIKEGKNILAEGAQGSMLDIDFGTYPFVTSSNTVSAGVCLGLGVSPQSIGKVIGITKAYCTRVGSGPFPTELFDEDGERLRKEGQEFGATTGRPRRCGWIDIPQLNYTCMLNGVTELVVTKIDIFNSFEDIKMCTSYEINGENTEQVPFSMSDHEITPQYESKEGWLADLYGMDEYASLPEKAKLYLDSISDLLGVPVKYISTGPERESLIVR